MRSCVVPALLLLLLAANGYALWQIARLRAEVAELRAAVTVLDRREAESETSLAETALRAVRQARWEEARAAMERLADRVRATEALAEGSRRELQRRVAEARTAIGRKRKDAVTAVQALVREVSLYKKRWYEHREDVPPAGTATAKSRGVEESRSRRVEESGERPERPRVESRK